MADKKMAMKAEEKSEKRIEKGFAEERASRAKKEIKVETGKEKMEKRLAITGKAAKGAMEKPKEKPVKEMVVTQKTELEKPKSRTQRNIRKRSYEDKGTMVAKKESPAVKAARKWSESKKEKSSPLVERLRKERESKKVSKK